VLGAASELATTTALVVLVAGQLAG
jgi:hypothetical protein